MKVLWNYEAIQTFFYVILYLLYYISVSFFAWLLKLGANSGLHIIIFDEIDAICKQRGSMAGSTGVHDTVVNQLLSKIDGVEQLNNLLVIGENFL